MSVGSPFHPTLRVAAIFHESEALGAGVATLRALTELRSWGWTPSGWFPGQGPLVERAASVLAEVVTQSRPLAVSVRGWREPPGLATRLRETPAYLKALKGALVWFRPHVVHVNTLHAVPEAIAASRLGLPVVLHIHELPPPTRKRSAVISAGDRSADIIVAVSRAVASMLAEEGVRTPTLVVPNGVEPRAEERRPRGAPFRVGTVGTVSRRKGTDIFIEAARRVVAVRPEVRFEHVGPAGIEPEPGFDDAVRERATAPELRDRLALLGPRPAESVLPTWDLFVFPSRQDPFPLATLEAMAAGTPVIAAAVGGLPEQIAHLETGVLVPPDNPAALADWIVRLHDDAPLRERLAGEARRRVCERFTLERQARGLHLAYLAACNAKHAPAAVRTETLEALRRWNG